MAKIGVGIKLDLSKIDKSKVFKGEKGVYLDATVFIDTDSRDQHGNSGMIVQDWKDAPKGQTPILGNVRVFWQGESQTQQRSQGYNQNQAPKQPEPNFEFDDSLPDWD